jgi:polyphosphate kinase 2
MGSNRIGKMSDDNDDKDYPRYKRKLYELQVQLVKLQRELIAAGTRVLVIVEGRDGAGKDGTVKRLIEHMSPRETCVHAPGKPSAYEEGEWYFKRFVSHLPAAGEFVVFNRSWYNRAGVERVMGFCSKKDIEIFFDSVIDFEKILVRAGLNIRKYYLDISRAEQKKRLADRHKDPLKTWKNSPIDAQAIEKYDDYTEARDEMFRRSNHPDAPWHVVLANDKKAARLAFIGDLLTSFSYKGKQKRIIAPDRKIAFAWSRAKEDLLAK